MEAEEDDLVPATKVLAIASHVVYGYVGNTMATLCMQSLGCEVAAINTVNFSNHTGYGQWKGPRTTPETISELYQGLQQNSLLDFDVLLTGYIPSAAALQEVALIAQDLTFKATMKPGRFFWILDPVMGDQGKLYVSSELVDGYKQIIARGEPDLIVPNGFELELISGVSVTDGDAAGDQWQVDLNKVSEAIGVLHRDHSLRMVVVTSVRVQNKPGVLCVVGSEMKSDRSTRAFVIEIPVLDCYFSGTGDMFAGLMTGRLREACHEAGVLDQQGWQSPDSISAVDLPLAKATVKVLSSMSAVLEKTMYARNEDMKHADQEIGSVATGVDSTDHDKDKKLHLLSTKAAEVRGVRNARHLRQPKVCFEAQELDSVL